MEKADLSIRGWGVEVGEIKKAGERLTKAP